MPLLPRALPLAIALAVTVLVACAPAALRARRPDLGPSGVAVSPAPLPFLAELSLSVPAVPQSPSLPLLALPVESTPAPAAVRSKCNEQSAQSFLIRGSYIFQPWLPSDEKQARKLLHRAAIEYRTRHYGYVEGFGDPAWNARPPRDYAADARFFGINIRMNARVLVALGCVEEAIVRSCSHTPYVPHMLDGLRGRNTFHNNEVSNHLYGIAIDVDPDTNACCNCVAPARDAPICKKPAKTPFDHAKIPPCWVEAFERYGFYWLGRDVLEDTMHFEFLGDPDKIIAAGDSASLP